MRERKREGARGNGKASRLLAVAQLTPQIFTPYSSFLLGIQRHPGHCTAARSMGVANTHRYMCPRTNSTNECMNGAIDGRTPSSLASPLQAAPRVQLWFGGASQYRIIQDMLKFFAKLSETLIFRYRYLNL